MKSRTDKDLRAQGKGLTQTHTHTNPHSQSQKYLSATTTLFSAHLTQTAEVQHVSRQACVMATRQELGTQSFTYRLPVTADPKSVRLHSRVGGGVIMARGEL